MINNWKKYPSDFEAKKLIIDIGKRIYENGFVAANDGNISCKVSEDTIWTTPTGVSKGYMTQDMLVKMKLDGRVIAGRLKPSSEVKMHIRVYEENPEVMAVTHAHPPVSTSFAIAGISLDKAILPEAVVQLGSVPVAKYATPGTAEVPDSIAPYVKTHNGVLLANHGALTWGKDLTEAYYRLESLEYYAKIIMYTDKIIQKQNVLSCGQVDELIGIRSNLGIESGGTPYCDTVASNTEDVISYYADHSNQKVEARNQNINLLNNNRNLKNTTEIIKPNNNFKSQENMSEKDKLIAEVVKNVTNKLKL